MNETVMENIIRPAAVAIKSYFPKALIALTLLCVIYAACLALRYYIVVRKDESKKDREVQLIYKGARSIITMYLAYIAVRIVFALVLRFIGLQL